MRLLPYTKRAIRFGAASVVLFALTLCIGKLMPPDAFFNGDVQGTPYAGPVLAAMFVIGLLAIVMFCIAVFYAITSEANRWK